MSDQGRADEGRLRELVQRWRVYSGHIDAAPVWEVRAAFNLCADELEAALKAAAPSSPQENPRRLLTAPCRWCGYNGPSYWAEQTHEATCRWRNIGGEANRLAALIVEAPLPSPPRTTDAPAEEET